MARLDSDTFLQLKQEAWDRAMYGRQRELAARDDLLPPSVRLTLARAAEGLAPQKQTIPRQRWARLVHLAMKDTGSLGFVTIDGTQHLSQLLAGRPDRHSSVGELLHKWEAAGLAQGFDRRGHGRKPTLAGVQITALTEAALWVVDRRFWALTRSGPRHPAMYERHALQLACESLQRGDLFPPAIYTIQEAEAALV